MSDGLKRRDFLKVLGASGAHYLVDGRIEGDDPLAPFSPKTREWFARAVRDAGLVFVGPPAEAIALYRERFGFTRPYLKIDTQGFDIEVLRGGLRLLAQRLRVGRGLLHGGDALLHVGGEHRVGVPPGPAGCGRRRPGREPPAARRRGAAPWRASPRGTGGR